MSELKELLKDKKFWIQVAALCAIFLAGISVGIAKGVKIVEEDAAFYVFDNFYNNSEFLRCMGYIEPYEFPYLEKFNNSMVMDMSGIENS